MESTSDFRTVDIDSRKYVCATELKKCIDKDIVDNMLITYIDSDNQPPKEDSNTLQEKRNIINGWIIVIVIIIVMIVLVVID